MNIRPISTMAESGTPTARWQSISKANGDTVRVLVYKRTHSGDPSPNGCFGVHDCMGQVKSWNFGAVIGVGGIGPEPRHYGIARQVNWIGIGPHKDKNSMPEHRGPLVTFDHFLAFGIDGPDFRALAPLLAETMYGSNIRLVMIEPDQREYREVMNILKLAQDAPPSWQPSRRNRTDGSDGCTVKSRKGRIC